MAGLDGLGVWAAELRFGDPEEAAADAAFVESLGYTAAWIPDLGGDLFGPLSNLLAATSSLTVASGVLNVWFHPAADTARWWTDLDAAQRSRVLLGLGIGHAPHIGERWGRPIATMAEYLDGLDAGGVDPRARCLAALGPRMLELSRDRTAGALPYLVTPEHTAIARDVLGDAGLFVEQGVVLETDPDVARTIARGTLDLYAGLPNYVNNWKRLGFTDDEVATRADRLIDALFAWGDADTIRARVDAHRAAGADHVCIQVIGAADTVARRAAWEALAP